ncbi:hypothetical protein [Oryzibacter oryziterrae]|uniref:hypothetical protein n=1 Tax=Oryzibacter oryziterrae TaxID=2766474 RepID=UPI001F368D34|nr:hypothetical protein [Oryzibacter oryziterrae]
MPPSHPTSGYILVLTLFLLLLLSAASLTLTFGLRGFAVDVADTTRAVERQTARQAGVALALAAVDAGVFGEDVTRLPHLVTGGISVDVALEARPVTADVNAAPPELLKAVTSTLLPAPLGQQTYEAIEAERRAGRRIPSIRALLPPCRRLTADRDRLEAVLTVGTREPTINRASAPPALLAALPGMTPLALKLIEDDPQGTLVLPDDPRIAPVSRFLGSSGGSSRLTVTVSDGPAHWTAALHIATRRKAAPILTGLDPSPSPIPDRYCPSSEG